MIAAPLSELRPAPSFLVVLGQAAALAGRHWPLVLPLYLPGLVLAAQATVPAAQGLLDVGTLGPWASQAAAGDLLHVLIEAGLSSAAPGAPGSPPPQLAALQGRLLQATGQVLLGVVLNGLAYSVLAGGVLARLAGDSSTRFLDACRHWAWPMLRFGLLLLLVFPLLAAVGTIVVALVPGNGGSAISVKLLLLAGWLAWVNSVLEYARADMVIRGDPRAWRALVRALTLPAQPGLFVQAALAWAALAILGAVAWSLAAPLLLAVSATLLAAAFLLQQALALAGAWLKLLRLGAAVQLAAAGAALTPSTRSANMEAP